MASPCTRNERVEKLEHRGLSLVPSLRFVWKLEHRGLNLVLGFFWWECKLSLFPDQRFITWFQDRLLDKRFVCFSSFWGYNRGLNLAESRILSQNLADNLIEYGKFDHFCTVLKTKHLFSFVYRSKYFLLEFGNLAVRPEQLCFYIMQVGTHCNILQDRSKFYKNLYISGIFLKEEN